MSDLRATLRRLERLARSVGAPVRWDVTPKAKGYVVHGGLCTVNGRSMIVCDRALPLVDKVVVVAEVLASLGVDVLELPEILRARLRVKGRAKVKPKKTNGNPKGRGLVEKAG